MVNLQPYSSTTPGSGGHAILRRSGPEQPRIQRLHLDRLGRFSQTSSNPSTSGVEQRLKYSVPGVREPGSVAPTARVTGTFNRTGVLLSVTPNAPFGNDQFQPQIHDRWQVWRKRSCGASSVSGVTTEGRRSLPLSADPERVEQGQHQFSGCDGTVAQCVNAPHWMNLHTSLSSTWLVDGTSVYPEYYGTSGNATCCKPGTNAGDAATPRNSQWAVAPERRDRREFQRDASVHTGPGHQTGTAWTSIFPVRLGPSGLTSRLRPRTTTQRQRNAYRSERLDDRRAGWVSQAGSDGDILCRARQHADCTGMTVPAAAFASQGATTLYVEGHPRLLSITTPQSSVLQKLNSF